MEEEDVSLLITLYDIQAHVYLVITACSALGTRTGELKPRVS